MLNIVKNQRKTNAKDAAAVPSADASLGDDWLSCDALISPPTRKSEMPCVQKEIKRDFLRPKRSITNDAAAVPKIPRVLIRPASQLDL